MLIPAAAQAQDAGGEEQPKPPKLFESDEIMAVTMRGPWRRVEKNKSSPETFPGALEYTDSGGQSRTMEIGVTTRGLTRRDRVCDFPPLKLWFDKEQVRPPNDGSSITSRNTWPTGSTTSSRRSAFASGP